MEIQANIAAVVLMSAFILFIIGMGCRQMRYEKQCWNNGICADSGKSWFCFDMDSQGGRMYSDGEGHRCSISYNVDRVIRRSK